MLTRYLILGFGQDALLSALELYRCKVPFMILTRRSQNASIKLKNFPYLIPHIRYAESIDVPVLLELKDEFKFGEILNFAANSFVQDSKVSFSSFIETNSRIVWEIIKFIRLQPNVILFHPLSSELFNTNSNDIFEPRNAYGLAKLVDYHSCRIACEFSDLKIDTCILFNHESIHRPGQFFTKKVISGIFSNDIKELRVYNAKSKRDWGYAPEYIKMILSRKRLPHFSLLQLGTGQLFSVEQFIDTSFELLNIDYSKSESGNLLKWSSDKLNIIETNRDEVDESRNVCADKKAVIESFGNLPNFCKKELVKQLIYDFQK